MSVIHVPPEAIVLAMDVHKNTISTGVLEPGSTRVMVDKISTDGESIRRLIARFERPTESSSGERQYRGGITHAGNVHLRTQLVESAWSYRARPLVAATLRRRQQGVHPDTIARSWAAQQRLCSRFRRLDARKHNRKVVVTAIARELAGFVWAEATADNT